MAAATITETVGAEGHVYYLGTLAGVRVVLARTGIGLVNADASARDGRRPDQSWMPAKAMNPMAISPVMMNVMPRPRRPSGTLL